MIGLWLTEISCFMSWTGDDAAAAADNVVDAYWCGWIYVSWYILVCDISKSFRRVVRCLRGILIRASLFTFTNCWCCSLQRRALCDVLNSLWVAEMVCWPSFHNVAAATRERLDKRRKRELIKTDRLTVRHHLSYICKISRGLNAVTWCEYFVHYLVSRISCLHCTL